MMKNDTNTNPNTPAIKAHDVQKKAPLFSCGTVVATPAVITHFSENNIEIEPYLVQRHLQSDWGDVPPEDAIANDLAVENGLRILSAYVAANRRFWIITEADRSVTTFLFPEEY
ncbi:hypothetical protein [Undibacterium danionis]|uniref:Type I restriction endonuclease subunit M n=1 Tax=Undibacterium danionis TaxID=1812100 RepID=A0ABV6IIX1_9BURK